MIIRILTERIIFDAKSLAPPFLFQSQIIYLNNNVTEINIICQNYFDLHVTADLEPKLEDKWVLNRLSQLFTMVGFFLAIAILHLFIAEKWAETFPPFRNNHFRKYFSDRRRQWLSSLCELGHLRSDFLMSVVLKQISVSFSVEWIFTSFLWNLTALWFQTSIMKSTCSNTTIITITIEYFTHRPFDPGKIKVNEGECENYDI